MRIAQVSPLYERTPPIAYGGTERVVSYLTEELVRRGHAVTLFATADSITSAELVPMAERGLRLAGRSTGYDALPAHLAMIDEVFTRADEFDVLHFHTDYLHLALAARCHVPSLTTLHGRLDLPAVQPYFRRFSHLDYVSISTAQRSPMSWLHWAATVHHGLPRDLLTPVEEPGDYLAFLGRLSPEKGCERAVEIAGRAGMPLEIAGKIDPSEREYAGRSCVPLFDLPHVEYVGEIGGFIKDRFLGRARALLFPIDWPEPFGLVMIEAMATGTPVIAYRRGSVPEVIEDGVTGFVVDTLEDAVRAVAEVRRLDRRRIRRIFEQRYSVERMTDDYVDVYRDLCARGARHARDQHRHGHAGAGAARAALHASRP